MTLSGKLGLDRGTRMDEVCTAAAGGDNRLDASPTGVTIYNAKLTMGPAGTWMVAGRGFANGAGP